MQHLNWRSLRESHKGGGHHAANVELRCAAHNQHQADLDFGRSFMDARRSAGARP